MGNVGSFGGDFMRNTLIAAICGLLFLGSSVMAQEEQKDLTPVQDDKGAVQKDAAQKDAAQKDAAQKSIKPSQKGAAQKDATQKGKEACQKGKDAKQKKCKKPCQKPTQKGGKAEEAEADEDVPAPPDA